GRKRRLRQRQRLRRSCLLYEQRPPRRALGRSALRLPFGDDLCRLAALRRRDGADRELAGRHAGGGRRDRRFGADADPLCADAEGHHADTLLVEALLAACPRRSGAGAVKDISEAAIRRTRPQKTRKLTRCWDRWVR